MGEEGAMKKVLQVLRAFQCRICGGRLLLLGLSMHTACCEDCGIVYQTMILEKALGHSISFSKDVECVEA